MNEDGYAKVRAQFFCRDCGHRWTVDAEVSNGGTGTSYRVAYHEEDDTSDDMCPFCDSEDTAIFKTKPAKTGGRAS